MKLGRGSLILFSVSDGGNRPAENVCCLERSFIRRLAASHCGLCRHLRSLFAMLIRTVVELREMGIVMVLVPRLRRVAFGEKRVNLLLLGCAFVEVVDVLGSAHHVRRLMQVLHRIRHAAFKRGQVSG